MVISSSNPLFAALWYKCLPNSAFRAHESITSTHLCNWDLSPTNSESPLNRSHPFLFPSLKQPIPFLLLEEVPFLLQDLTLMTSSLHVQSSCLLNCSGCCSLGRQAEPRSEERARPRPLRSLTHLFLFSKYYQNSYFTGGGRAQRNYQLD